MIKKLPATDFISLDEAFECFGSNRYGSDWPQDSCKRRPGTLSPRRIVEASLLEGIQHSEILYHVEGGRELLPADVVWIRVDSGQAVSREGGLFPILIETRSLLGFLRQWGLIGREEPLGRPTKVDWAEFVHAAWEYALKHDGHFGDEELRAEMREKADREELNRPTPTTLDRWATRIRNSFAEISTKDTGRTE